MQSNEFGVGWGTIKFFMEVLNSHSGYVFSYTREQDILFHLVLIPSNVAFPLNAQNKTVDVALSADYIMSEASVLAFRATFPTAKIIVLGGNWCKYTSEARCAAHGYGIKLMTLKEFVATLYSKRLVDDV